MKIVIVCTFIFLTPTLFSCDPCNNLDCITSNYDGQFRIVSKVDGKDLVFGQNRVYDQSLIRFYAVNGIDTTVFDCKPMKFPGTGYDSILNVSFYPVTDKPVYLKLNDMDTDTLDLAYNTYRTKCCGTITEIRKLRYNNSLDIPGNKGTQEIKK